MKKNLCVSIAVFLFLFIFLPCGPVFSASPDPRPPELSIQAKKNLRAGIEQYKQENYEEAAQILEQVRVMVPASTSAAFFLGLTYKQMQDYPRAVKNLRDAVTLTPRIKEALVELVEVLYRLPEPENLVEAEKWLQVAEQVKIFPAKTAFLKGLVLLKGNKSRAAITAFEKAKTLDQSLTQSAEIQIALAYVKEKNLKTARQRLKAAIVLDPQSDLAGFARRYQDVVEKRLELEKPLRTTVSLFAQYNDNLLSKPNEPERYYGIIDDASSRTFVGSLRLDYVPLLPGPWIFSGQYAFSGSLNTEHHSTHDSVSNSFTVTPGYNFGRYSLSLMANYNYFMLRTNTDKIPKRYMSHTRIGPLFRIIVTKTQILELFSGYNHKKYYRPPVSANEDRNADGLSAYASWIWLYKENGLVNLRYEYTDENTDGPWWTYKGHSFSASATVPLRDRLSLQLSIIYFRQNFDYPTTDFDLIAGTRTDKIRKDKTFSGSVGLTWSLDKNTSLIFQYSRTRVDSNIGRNDYQRNLYNVGIEYRF
ncbi:MAG: tetratricopeptide repeat protein [Desulfobacterales bacterium]|nr:tetratricopeptide repeat protein [Desulfobacterales bacterium]